eukprot:m.515 g.515  ORF g.515 m.515 type:complete len:90 (-) comp238_c0_seq1:67-336(-)
MPPLLRVHQIDTAITIVKIADATTGTITFQSAVPSLLLLELTLLAAIGVVVGVAVDVAVVALVLTSGEHFPALPALKILKISSAERARL